MARACAMIVAAGLSSRMGKLKALLPVGGEPMIRLTAKKLLEADAEEIVAVTGYRREEIEAALAGLPVRFAHNENYAVTQMFDSVKLGLRAVPEEYGRVLSCPVDCPSFQTDTARQLLEIWGDFVTPLYNGKAGHPIVIDRSAFPAVLAYEGEGGLRGAMEQEGLFTRYLAVNDGGILADVDTPRDYETLLAVRK